MRRDAILRALTTAGHETLTTEVEALIRPAIFLAAHHLHASPSSLDGAKGEASAGQKKFDAAMKKLGLGASRFGGIPDLPPGIEWPTRDGVPMEFVAQIRLTEIASHDTEGALPHRGSLLFFFNSQWLTFDQDDGLDGCRVILHEGPDDQLVRTPAPSIAWQGEDDDESLLAPKVHGLASLTFSRYEMVPGGISPFIKGKSALGKTWQAFTSEYGGTYSPALDGAHYVENHLLGYVDAADYVGAHANGVDDRCLLQVDSDEAADFQWGDCDRLYFMMTKAELAARDFSKVRVYSLLG